MFCDPVDSSIEATVKASLSTSSDLHTVPLPAPPSAVLADAPVKHSLVGFVDAPVMLVSDVAFLVVIGMSVLAWVLIVALAQRARSVADYVQTSLVLLLVPLGCGWFVAVWRYEELLDEKVRGFGELASPYYSDAASGAMWLAIQALLWSIPGWFFLSCGRIDVDARFAQRKGADRNQRGSA